MVALGVNRIMVSISIDDLPPEELVLAMAYMNRLIKNHNWSEYGAATAAACAKSESDFRTEVEGDKDLPNHAHGMHQWRLDRYDNPQPKHVWALGLLQFAAMNHVPWTDFNNQIAFVDYETSTRSIEERHWKHCLTLEEGTACGKLYEGYAGKTQPARFEWAKIFLQAYRDSVKI